MSSTAAYQAPAALLLATRFMNSVSRGGHSRGNVMPLRGSAFAATGEARGVVSTHPGAAQEARHPTTAQEIVRARVIARLDFLLRDV